MASDIRAILSRYPSAIADLTWTPLGAAGGFSGAAIWRGDLAGQPAFCLKAWPPGYPYERLITVHRWMSAAQPSGLVPTVVPTSDDNSLVEFAGRVWDMTGWMPGAADFRNHPTTTKLTAACAALATLHRCWAPPQPPLLPCPGVLRRLAILRTFPESVRNSGDGTLTDQLRSHVPAAIEALLPWTHRPVPVFPCLCDVWHDHVFYDADRVTGFIDFGAMKIDHPAVDLARLLGDLVSGDPEQIRLGIDAYHTAGGPVAIDPLFVAMLDQTGVVCAVIFWASRSEAACSERISDRIRHLISRLDHF